MARVKITPEKITSPIQLMAAWFALIVLLTSILLTAAHNIEHPWWAAGFLVIFSAAFIISVLGCVLLMLTKFRPHLQDGKEYAQWLRDQNKYSKVVLSSREVSSIVATAQAEPPKVNSTKTFDKSARFDDYIVEISPLPDSKKLLTAYEESGFSASIYNTKQDDSYTRHKAIWVGYRVPANVAISAIQIALSQWQHLEYVELSDDGSSPPDEIHDQLYIGGSTSTALERGLLEWTVEELAALDPHMTTEKFHSIIRSKYSRNS